MIAGLTARTCVVADAEPVGDAGAPPFAEHVGPRREVERARSAFVAAQVDDDAALVRRDVGEQIRGTCASGRRPAVRACSTSAPRSASICVACGTGRQMPASSTRIAVEQRRRHAMTPSGVQARELVVVAAGELAQHRVGARRRAFCRREVVDPAVERDRQARRRGTRSAVAGASGCRSGSSRPRCRELPDRSRPRSARAPGPRACRAASMAASTSAQGACRRPRFDRGVDIARAPAPRSRIVGILVASSGAP